MPRWIGAVTLGCSLLACARGAEASQITFDLTGSQLLATSIVVADSTTVYSLTALGVNGFDGSASAAFMVDRDTNGLGIDSSDAFGLGADLTDFIENAGPNDQLRLDLGANSFQLVSVMVIMPPGVSGDSLLIFLGGEGDPTAEFGAAIPGGLFIPASPLVSSTFDLASASPTGIKIAQITFETTVPEPGTLWLFGAGAAILAGRRGRQSRRAS